MATSPEGSSSNANASIISGSAHGYASHHFSAAPNLSIKLDDKNFLLWNQQVEGVIMTHKVHRLLVNPEIPQKFLSDSDRLLNKTSDAYDKWIVQDQMLFTWLLSTLSESVLPRVLGCRHASQVWDKIHTHYFAHLKAKVRQLRSELKNTKKGTRTISEYVTKIHSIADSLVATGETIHDQDLVDIILDGLPEEYNAFVMIMYGKTDIPNLSEIEALLLVQESQLDKFRQELASTITTNVAHTTSRSAGQSSNDNSGGNFGHFTGNNHGRGRGRQGTRPTCQLCNRYGHAVIDCWFRFDETFVPPNTAVHTAENVAASNTGAETTTTADTSTDQAEALVTSTSGNLQGYTDDLTWPQDLDSENWSGDTCASHHFTSDSDNLEHSVPYTGIEKVLGGNGHRAPTKAIGSAKLRSPLAPHITLAL